MNAMSRNRAIFIVVIAVMLVIGIVIGFVYTQITPTEPPSIGTSLGVAQTPKYGSIDLKHSDEPYTFDVTSDGGTIDISAFPKYNDLSAGACTGFTNATPILRVNVPSAGDNLDFYFVSSGSNDATLLALDPKNDLYVCDQDVSAGDSGLKAAFVDYGSGAYTLWLASRTSGAAVSGKLYVTEDEIGHP